MLRVYFKFESYSPPFLLILPLLNKIAHKFNEERKHNTHPCSFPQSCHWRRFEDELESNLRLRLIHQIRPIPISFYKRDHFLRRLLRETIFFFLSFPFLSFIISHQSILLFRRRVKMTDSDRVAWINLPKFSLFSFYFSRVPVICLIILLFYLISKFGL